MISLQTYLDQDGSEHPTLVALGKIGTKGLHPQNCHKELMRCIQVQDVATAIQTLQLPYKQLGLGALTGDLSILYPHVLFATLWKMGSQTFLQKLCNGSAENLQLFWTKAAAHPFLRCI